MGIVYSDVYLTYSGSLRGEICRFISKDGKDALKWYFHAISETPLSYLTRTMMHEDKIWGSEVEIFERPEPISRRHTSRRVGRKRPV